MILQNYCMINAENICDNICIWDGNTDTWQPPADYTMLVQATTPAMIWWWDGVDWVLTQVIGQGQIGFIWDGLILTTNQPKPELLKQPTTSGTKTI